MSLQITYDENGKPVNFNGDHVVLLGPIRGTVTKADGTLVDVTPPVIELHPDDHAEVAHLVALRYAAEGHPHDVEVDDDTGQLVQREFVYEAPAEFADYVPHPDNKTLEV